MNKYSAINPILDLMKRTILFATTAVLLAPPALRAAELTNLAVPNNAATTSADQNSIELRMNGLFIAKSSWAPATPATLLATDEWTVGLLWHPAKFAFRAGGIPLESDIAFASAALGDAAATAEFSFAAGASASANGYGSVALGQYVIAMGVASTALGQGIASADYSFAANAAWAAGVYSAAFGTGLSSGYGSSAFGLDTFADGTAQTVVGMSNIRLGSSSAPVEPTDPLFIVGNGTSGVRSNAFTVFMNGNAEVSGQLEVSGKITMSRQGDILMGEFGN